jgi:hypothetical protein
MGCSNRPPSDYALQRNRFLASLRCPCYFSLCINSGCATMPRVTSTNFAQIVRLLFGAAVAGALLPSTARAAVCTSTTIPAGDICDANGLAPSGTIAFTGGTLLMNTVSQSFPQNFTLKSSAANTIDQDGNANTFSGVFSDLTSTGKITIVNSRTGGSVTFGGTNTYTAAPRSIAALIWHYREPAASPRPAVSPTTVLSIFRVPARAPALPACRARVRARARSRWVARR